MKLPGRAGGAEEGRFHLDLIKGSVPGGTGRKEAKIISERTKAPEAKGEREMVVRGRRMDPGQQIPAGGEF